MSGTLVGAGASSQAAAMQAWQAGFQEANPDATVEYDPVGSGGGRETFLAGGSDFAGSDAYMDDEEYAASVDRCAGDQGAINLPHYISPIAMAYNLPDVDGETLNLSPATIAGIFAGAITSWNDRGDRRRQPRRRRCRTPRSTRCTARTTRARRRTSPTTCAQSAPDVWTYGAHRGVAPRVRAVAKVPRAPVGVVAAVTAGEGSIGYADASQIGDLRCGRVRSADEFVAVLARKPRRSSSTSSERVEGRSEYDYAIDLVQPHDRGRTRTRSRSCRTTSSACSTTTRRRSTSSRRS